ncbi:MAG: hypothetical protein EAS52_06000 [Parapedobacter sp.]|nr:MAG: hypothetical protein EAS52_06000 [Parapedobacter sp.]
MQEHSFKAGTAQVAITPPLGTVINGEFTSRYANHIADPLYAKAMVMQDDGTTLLFLVVDICVMQRDFLDEVKKIIAEQTGIPAQNQLISSTHTHSAGSVADLLMGHVDWGYRKKLPALLAKAALKAQQNLVPARVGYGWFDEPRHMVCRRYRMKGDYRPFNPVSGGVDAIKTNPFGDEPDIVERTSEPDTELRYVAVKGIDDQWIGLLANYSLHYVGDCERGTISADYFGCFAKELAELLGAGSAFVGMMSNGTSGEVNIWDFLDPDRYPSGSHEKSRLIGKELAAGVAASLKNVVWETQPVLGSRYAEITVGLRKPTPTELERAKELVEQTDYEHIHFDQRGYQQVYAREQVLLAEYPDEKQVPVQTFRIGSGLIGALPGEFFAETGLHIKASRPDKKYFTICLANDYVGYVPPAHELEKGGYECWRCRSSHLAENAEGILRDSLMAQINSL